jgi:hypothetical protein
MAKPTKAELEVRLAELEPQNQSKTEHIEFLTQEIFSKNTMEADFAAEANALAKENFELFETRTALLEDIEGLNDQVNEMLDWSLYVVKILEAIVKYNGSSIIYPQILVSAILLELDESIEEEKETADGV